MPELYPVPLTEQMHFFMLCQTIRQRAKTARIFMMMIEMPIKPSPSLEVLGGLFTHQPSNASTSFLMSFGAAVPRGRGTG